MIISVQAGHVRLDLHPDHPGQPTRWTVMRLHERIGEALVVPGTEDLDHPHYTVRLGQPHRLSIRDTSSYSASVWDAAGQLARQLFLDESASQQVRRAARKGLLL